MATEESILNSEKTIKDWVNNYSDQLFTWAYYKTSDKEASEDLVQETFIVAFKSFDNFKEKSSPKTLLISILKNKIADHFRKVYRTNAHKTFSFDQFFNGNDEWAASQRPENWSEEHTENLLDNSDFKKILSNCLQKLPETWKSFIILKFIEEKDSSIICQELEISSTYYWQIIHRAKLQLRKCLELNWFKS